MLGKFWTVQQRNEEVRVLGLQHETHLGLLMIATTVRRLGQDIGYVPHIRSY